MPRRRPPDPPPRRERGQGSVAWVARRKRWRARLPALPGEKVKESWHLTRDEAEAWIARELARTDDAFDPASTLRDYFAYWFRLQGAEWGEQTRIRYLYQTHSLGDARLDLPLKRLRGDHVAAAKADILARGTTSRHAHDVLLLLTRALRDAVTWRILAENVAATVTLPKPERTHMPAWTADEAKAVLAAIVGHRFEAVYLLILWGGLRIGETMGLRWDQIHDNGTVAFDSAEKSSLKGHPLGSTKGKGERETELPLHVVARLRELRAIGPVGVASRGRAVAYVYVSQRPDGNRWTARTIRQDWNQLVASVKYGDLAEAVKPLRPHGGRHTLATMHMVSGTPLADLAKMLGHASPAITAAIYLDSSRDRRKDAAGKLADLLEPQKGQVEGHQDG